MIRCPSCKEQLKSVRVRSSVWQDADVTRYGRVWNYAEADYDEPTEALCDQCDRDVTHLVKFS
jgi:hypothetical protein